MVLRSKIVCLWNTPFVICRGDNSGIYATKTSLSTGVIDTLVHETSP